MGVLAACPTDDLAPLIAWMAKRRREKVRRHLNQHRVLLLAIYVRVALSEDIVCAECLWPAA